MKIRTAPRLTAAAALGVGVLLAAPAVAAPSSTTQDGLVNLSLSDTTVQLPIALAANVCGVSVNALATATGTGPVECDGVAASSAERQGGGGSKTRQSGLVNVAITDTTVQVPVAVAANVCGVSVNLISSLNLVGPTTCDALADATAQG